MKVLPILLFAASPVLVHASVLLGVPELALAALIVQEVLAEMLLGAGFAHAQVRPTAPPRRCANSIASCSAASIEPLSARPLPASVSAVP